MMYLENKFELDNIKSKSNSEKDIGSTALMMREKIKTLKDTMPWPPDVRDLDKLKINNTDYLELFLSTLLSGCSMESSNSKVNWLKLSIGQDLVYAITGWPWGLEKLEKLEKCLFFANGMEKLEKLVYFSLLGWKSWKIFFNLYCTFLPYVSITAIVEPTLVTSITIIIISYSF